jgi:primary-amine oxidase
VCWNTADGQAYRANVTLPEGMVTDWQHLPGVQPNVTVDEWHECASDHRAALDVPPTEHSRDQ